MYFKIILSFIMTLCKILFSEGPKLIKGQFRKTGELGGGQNAMGNIYISLYKTVPVLHEGKKPLFCSLLCSLVYCLPEQRVSMVQMCNKKANE